MTKNVAARRNRRSALLFMLPGALFFAVIFIYPSLKTIQMAFSDVNADNITQGNWPFVGLKNFAAVFTLQATGITVMNTVVFLVGSIVPQVVVGLLLAIGLRKSSRIRRIGRALVLLPWLLPSVAVSSVFLFIFYTNGGLANWVLLALHATTKPILWFANPGTALFVIVLVNIWIGIPFNFLIIQSGLQSLPTDIREAAAVDGAGWWRELFSITIPMLRESLFAVVMLGVIGTLKVFDFVWIMTGGGPANGTMLPGPLAYQQAFVAFNYGRGSAIIVLTVLLMVVLSVIYVRATSPRDRPSVQGPRLPAAFATASPTAPASTTRDVPTEAVERAGNRP